MLKIGKNGRTKNKELENNNSRINLKIMDYLKKKRKKKCKCLRYNGHFN